MNFKPEIKDFIGIFPDAVSEDTCKRLIEHYEYVNSLGRSQPRSTAEGTRYIDKDNETYFLSNSKMAVHPDDYVLSDLDHYFATEFTNAFWRCFATYQAKYGVLASLGKLGFTGKIKLQKTEPGEGYHVWHCEQGDAVTSTRLLLVILYLNDVAEGGETEFLYQGQRVPAKRGTMMICPGSFTHTHRGNPPLTGVKYIMNTWVEFTQ
jgi:hypothetical protein